MRVRKARTEYTFVKVCCSFHRVLEIGGNAMNTNKYKTLLNVIKIYLFLVSFYETFFA